jgi:hypothetical protein
MQQIHPRWLGPARLERDGARPRGGELLFHLIPTGLRFVTAALGSPASGNGTGSSRGGVPMQMLDEEMRFANVLRMEANAASRGYEEPQERAVCTRESVESVVLSGRECGCRRAEPKVKWHRKLG